MKTLQPALQDTIFYISAFQGYNAQETCIKNKTGLRAVPFFYYT